MSVRRKVTVPLGSDAGRPLRVSAMSLWPNKGEADTRPPLRSGYQRVRPVMPHHPAVPAGAPAELRLDAKKADVIPDYPY